MIGSQIRTMREIQQNIYLDPSFRIFLQKTQQKSSQRRGRGTYFLSPYYSRRDRNNRSTATHKSLQCEAKLLTILQYLSESFFTENKSKASESIALHARTARSNRAIDPIQ